MSCGCSADWRLEALDLESGVRRRYLPFLSFEFEELLNQIGSGSISVPRQRVTLRDIYPHLTAIAFTRIAGPGASPTSPVCEYIGMVETVEGRSQDALSIGVKSIENYLTYRIFKDDFGQDVIPAPQLGATMVNYNRLVGRGIQLFADQDPSANDTSCAYTAEMDTVVWDALDDLTSQDDGPDFVRQHTPISNGWQTNLHFSDEAGIVGGQLDSRRGMTAYGINIDATTHANWVRGRSEEGASFEGDLSPDSIYPRFDLGIKVSDAGLYLRFLDLINGLRRNVANPLTIPDVTVTSLDVACRFGMGDTPTVDLNDYAIQYHGQGRIVGKAWRVGPDEPTTCTFSFLPPSAAGPEVVAPLPTLDATGSGDNCCD